MDDLTKQRRWERFENSYERDHRVRHNATVAGRIINESAAGVPAERPAKLAADVGRKLRDYTTKQTSSSVLYSDCQVPFDKMEFATVIAFRSMTELDEPDMVPEKVKDHFAREKPQGFVEIDEWINHQIRSLTTIEYRPASKFKEPGMRTGVYWGLEPKDIGRVVDIDIDDFKIPTNLFPARKDDEALDLTRAEFRESTNFVIDKINHSMQSFATAMLTGDVGERKNIHHLASGVPVIGEKDQIDIYCTRCPPGRPRGPFDTWESLQDHWDSEKHGASSTIIPSMGRPASVLKNRDHPESRKEARDPRVLLKCPDCGLRAEMWDAVYWHHSNIHRGSGSLEDRLPLEERLKYLVWVGTRTPIGCEWCVDDQHRSTVHHLTQLVSDEHAEDHETTAEALRKLQADEDEELSDCGERKKPIDYDFSTIELSWRGSDPCHLCEQLVKKKADFLLI